MDSLTQAALGAALQGGLLGRQQGRKALVYGAALGTLPDLDVLIRYSDAVAQMTYHRGFSHSIFVFSAFSLLLTGWVRRRWPQAPYSSARLALCIWLILLTHVLIDACTTYGTQLFWPLPSTPLNFSNIFVIDPLYTLPLLLGIAVAAIWGMAGRGWRWLNMGLALSTVYMASTFANQALMRQNIEAQLAAQNIDYQQLLVMPTPFNSLAWRVLARDEQHYYEGLRSWLDTAPLHIDKQPLGLSLREVLADSPQHQRLRWFNNDWMSYREEQGQLWVTDLRLGLLGNHSFRFKMAERDAQGAWQLLPIVQRAPMQVQPEELKWLWRGLFDQAAEQPPRAE